MYKKLVKKLDEVFSKWIRQREEKCFTCGSIQDLQAGHYISRNCLLLRWDKCNVHTQCKVCNEYKNGNLEVFKQRLVYKYGLDTVENLERMKFNIVKFTHKDLKELINKYK